MSTMKGVVRIDQADKRNHCYLVRVGYVKLSRGRYVPVFTSTFSDAAYGGKRRALRAARRFATRAARWIATMDRRARVAVARTRLYGTPGAALL